jgi:hypothetical protein
MDECVMETCEAAIEYSWTADATLLLRLFVPFVLGAVLTLVVTSVNHRRDHIKHVRDTLSFSIRDISQKGTAFWSTEYDSESMVQLRGSIVYLQHILPYAFESTNVSGDVVKKMRDLFARISHVALFSDTELDANSHKVDLDRIAELLVLCARADALCNTSLLERMSFAALISSAISTFWGKARDFLIKAHDVLLVP